MILTIGQTAKAVQLSKTSICKHIQNGKLSATWNNDTNPPQREIDASEILRVYGVDVTLPPSRRLPADAQKPSVDTPLDMVVKAKDETIATLKAELDRLVEQIKTKDEQIAAANKLLAAPKADPYADLVEKLAKLEREFSSTQAAPEAPSEPKTEPASAPNRGIFGWFKGKAA